MNKSLGTHYCYTVDGWKTVQIELPELDFDELMKELGYALINTQVIGVPDMVEAEYTTMCFEVYVHDTAGNLETASEYSYLVCVSFPDVVYHYVFIPRLPDLMEFLKNYHSIIQTAVLVKGIQAKAEKKYLEGLKDSKKKGV